MKLFTKFFIVIGVIVFGGCVWYASKIGYGLSSLNDPSLSLEARQTSCPDWKKDAYGNCPPRSHRSRLGVRSFSDGGGK